MARNKKSLTILASIFSIIIGLIVGFVGSIYLAMPASYMIPQRKPGESSIAAGELNVSSISSNDLSIHFLELGNKYTGDCSFIKVGDTEILIDAGSKASSIDHIKAYIEPYITDGVLDYVVVTHAHEDHYAGFATNAGTKSLFDHFKVGTIIEFAKTNKTESNKMYANYIRERNEEVADSEAKVFTALECVEETNGASREFELGNNTIMQILYQKFYEETAHTENDYSVCLQIVNGGKKYLFTGDLEEDGEESLVDCEENAGLLGHVEIYKAGHHGSKTSSTTKLLNIITPSQVCVCCCAGSSEYTQKNENQFPTQEFINRVAPHTDKIYVTTLCIDYKANSFESFNGTIVYCFKTSDADNSKNGEFWYFSKNSTILKNTQWFAENRIWP